jgi:hypothetical protein
VKTLHGQFEFWLQKYLQEGQSVSYFDLTEQLRDGYVSERLQELSAYYSNRLSYQEVEHLVERMTGERLLSDQKIWQIVTTQAMRMSERITTEVKTTLAGTVGMPAINAKVDVYDAASTEIFLLDDGIQVKEQKGTRTPATPTKSSQLESTTPALRTRVNTDVVLLQTPAQTFEYICAPIDATGAETVSLANVVQTRLIQQYANATTPLNVVAITDGAKAIRGRLLAIFGVAITVILDWYHLSKKLRELMSMVARNKSEKAVHLRELFCHLWHGRVQSALEYLQTQVQARNSDKLAELVGYLEKHRAEIIDYDRRKRAGKTIGSGRIEKGVDLVIGHRQKKKGTSWRPKGSKALAILKVIELNQQWLQTWFPAQLA